jgi:membrane protease YdiL (CAAX protease family)
MVSTAIALVAVLGFVVALALLSGRSLSWPPADVEAPVAVFVAVQAFGALCEELGWRGVVQRVGEQFARPAVVSAIAGFLFGVTHLGYWSLGVVPVLTFAITATLMSLTITTIFTGSLWQRMLPAVVVHLGVNLGVVTLADQGEPLATTSWALGAAIVMLGIALVGRAAANRLRTRILVRTSGETSEGV